MHGKEEKKMMKEEKHKMPDGHMMSDKEMKKMKKKRMSSDGYMKT